MEFCKGVNVFIGSNGSGKTTLLKLLYAACNRTYENILQKNKRLCDFFQQILMIKKQKIFGKQTQNIV
ncbi:MAG: ATP-binding protein [Planctomycetaceae bacterium]|nr:ATP-binding protein [Planctomycetaceae bacterium]